MKRTRKNKILCVHSGGKILRGSEHALLEVMRGFKKAGRDVLLLCDQDTMFEAARTGGLEVRKIPSGELMFDPPDVKLGIIKLLFVNAAVRRNINSFQPDILYCNGGRACQNSLFAAAIAGKPIVVHLHAPYSRRYHLLYGTPFASAVIHCSESIKRYHESQIRFRNSLLVLNAVALDLMMAQSEQETLPRIQCPSKPVDRLVLGFLGSLISRKGLDILIDAVDLLIKKGYPVCLLIGGQETTAIYRDQVERLNIEEYVQFAGEVTNLPEFYSAIDIHVLPSQSEAFGRTIIEAALCGVFSIAHYVDGIPEAMIHGSFGKLYSPNDPEVLAKTISVIIDKGQWRINSGKLAALAKSKFGIDRAVDQVLQTLDAT